MFIVIAGGTFGLSLVNSIFVEAMLSDNTDNIKDKVDRKLDLLISEMKKGEQSFDYKTLINLILLFNRGAYKLVSGKLSVY